MSKLRKLLWSALFTTIVVTAQAQDSGGFGAEVPDSRTLAVQSKVDELFEKGEFERAYFIYRNELAPLGDKYAQYMVGYMHLMGMGVEEDEVQASAWYRLAAERDYPEFMAVRNQVLESLDEEELRVSDRTYVGLRKKYSDVVLVMRLLRRDFDEMTNRVTGSRLSGRSGSVTILDPNTRVAVSGDKYFRKIETRIQERLDYVTERLAIDRLSPNIDSRDLNELQKQVDQYVSAINDR